MEQLADFERVPFLERVGLRRPAHRLTERRFEAFFRASPVPAYIWRWDGEDLVLIAHNDAANVSSGRRAASYLGRRAADLYEQDEPDILEDLRRCARERSTFGREMSYTIPGTDETYDLRVTYAFAPPDLVLVLIVSVTEERRNRRELERSVADLHRTDRERRRLLHDLVSSQERERERIAGDVHDDTIQQLVAVSVRLETLRRKAPDSAEDIERLEEIVSDAVRRLRHMAFALHPPSLESGGLVAAVGSLLHNVESETGLRHTLVDEVAEEPPRELRIHAYRVVQEALMNVRKHARASSVEVRLVTGGGVLTLEVADDGIGFDLTEVPSDHLGLVTMRQRADLLGGRFEVSSRPGLGTLIRAEFPLRRPPIGRR